jgi:hypothetical protein
MQQAPKLEFLKLVDELIIARVKAPHLGIRAILEFCYDYPFLLHKKQDVIFSHDLTTENTRKFLGLYVNDFFYARERRAALPKVKTIADPALDVVLETMGKVSQKSLKTVSNHHRKAMAAENVLGELLEGYLAEVLSTQGWVWCSGNCMFGIDFFKPGCPVELLQIKNRSNSENSSSSKVRKLIKERGCPVEIKKWHRISANSGKTNWLKLQGNKDGNIASEAQFQEFIRKYAASTQAPEI